MSEDSRQCSVCGRPLELRLSLDEGVEWRHGGTPCADFAPVPLDPATAHPVCDFCAVPVPFTVATVRCEPFTLVTPGLDTRRDDGRWAACPVCVVLVRDGRWDALVDRALLMHERKNPGLTVVQRRFLRHMFVRLIRRVRAGYRGIEA